MSNMKRGSPGMLSLSFLLALAAACRDGAHDVTNPIVGVPLNQQRSIDRSHFRLQWPFTVGTGTLGCISGAVLFRAGDVNYALNDAASARGGVPVGAIRLRQGSGPPTHPLRRVRQETRQQIFKQAAGCDGAGREETTATICRQRVRENHRLSEPELKQIEAEGNERYWPPLEAPSTSLDPIVEAGLKLCR